MKHFSRSGTRLVGEERRKKKKKEEDEQFPSFNRFRLATLEQFLHTITAAVDWGSLYKLF